MPADSALVGLIAASLAGHDARRRAAARLVLDLLRSGSDSLAERLEAVSPNEDGAVAAEARKLVEEYGLAEPVDVRD